MKVAIILAQQLSTETCTHLLSINLLLQLLLTSQQPFPLSIMYLSNSLNSGLLFSNSHCPLCQWILALINSLSRAQWYCMNISGHLLYTRQGWIQRECDGSYSTCTCKCTGSEYNLLTCFALVRCLYSFLSLRVLLLEKTVIIVSSWCNLTTCTGQGLKRYSRVSERTGKEYGCFPFV